MKNLYLRYSEGGAMHFTVTADTDIGISKTSNQDSVLFKHGTYQDGEVLMAIICDGMGGLAKGELASATVIRAFSKWFDEELPYELEKLDLKVIGGKWSLMLKDLNIEMIQFSQAMKITMGTTFTGALFVGNEYLVVHVGDTRLYHISNGIRQITNDQTFIAREIKKGTMTVEQAKTDKRRNMLLQCVGASENLEPDVFIETQERGAYMICSDGFRHEISEREIVESLNPINLINKESMHSNVRYLIELVKQRNERDNISVILIKAD
jgi:serine/threonine protein phosphatase PrpC